MAQAESQADKLLNNQSTAQNFYCNIEIAGSSIPPRNISYLAIREWVLSSSLVPRLELSVYDDGLLTEVKTPYYNKQIFIELGRSEDDENPIELLFDIYDYTIDKVANESRNLINISGLISMESPFVIPERPIVYEEQTSEDIIKALGEQLFAPHSTYKFEKGDSPSTPADTMTWIQSYESNLDFLKNAIKYSYISPTECVLAFVDSKAQLNYKPLIASFTQAPAFVARFDIQMATSQSQQEMIKIAKQKGFTEDNAKNDMWYSSINFRDYSGTIRNQAGFSIETTFFDRTKTTYNSNIFSLNVNNTDADIYGEYVADDSYKTYYSYRGAIGINEAESNQNAISIRQNIISQLFAQSILLEINSFSDVKLFDTIDVMVNADIKIESGFPINEKLSGIYIVGGITHTVGGPGSMYKKVLTLFRTGVNKAGFSGVEE